MRKVRFRYNKSGKLRWLSHLEIARLLRRALRRAALPVAYSKGFHPHEQLSFGPPTAVGMASLEEYLDIVFEGEPAVDDLVDRLNKALPVGIRVSGGRSLGEGDPSIGRSVGACTYSCDCQAWQSDRTELIRVLNELSKLATLEVSSKRGVRTIDMSRLSNLGVDSGSGRLGFRFTSPPDVGPAAIVRAVARGMARDPLEVLVTRVEQA